MVSKLFRAFGVFKSGFKSGPPTCYVCLFYIKTDPSHLFPLLASVLWKVPHSGGLSSHRGGVSPAPPSLPGELGVRRECSIDPDSVVVQENISRHRCFSSLRAVCLLTLGVISREQNLGVNGVCSSRAIAASRPGEVQFLILLSTWKGLEPDLVTEWESVSRRMTGRVWERRGEAGNGDRAIRGNGEARRPGWDSTVNTAPVQAGTAGSPHLTDGAQPQPPLLP